MILRYVRIHAIYRDCGLNTHNNIYRWQSITLYHKRYHFDVWSSLKFDFFQTCECLGHKSMEWYVVIVMRHISKNGIFICYFYFIISTCCYSWYNRPTNGQRNWVPKIVKSQGSSQSNFYCLSGMLRKHYNLCLLHFAD